MLLNQNLLKLTVMVLMIGTLTAGRGEFRIDRFGNSEIRWADVVKINGELYYREENPKGIDAKDLRGKIGEVNFQIVSKVSNERYRIRNGDASFLEEGTELYSVDGEGDLIAAKVGGTIIFYRVREE